MVTTLPARTPGDPAEVQRPCETSTSSSPSLYLPSGIPVALIPSVIKMDFSATLRFVEQADHCRIHVNAIADDLGKKRVVIQYVSRYARIAVVHAAHGIKGMRGTARAGPEAGFGLHQGGVAVAQTAHHPKATGMFDQLERRRQLGGDGHDANMPTSRLPETIKQR